MKFTLEIECDNAAFEDVHCTASVARILREAAAYVGAQRRPSGGAHTVRDVNGNTCGRFEFTDD